MGKRSSTKITEFTLQIIFYTKSMYEVEENGPCFLNSHFKGNIRKDGLVNLGLMFVLT